MASRKRGLLSGGAKNPKPKSSASGNTQLTLTSSILKTQPSISSASSHHDSPDLFGAGEDDDDVEVLEPIPKRRQLRGVDTRATASGSSTSGIATRTRQRSSQASMAPPAASSSLRSAASQRSAASFFESREKPTPTKRRPQADPEDEVFQSTKKPKVSSPPPEDDGPEVAMKVRVHPPKKTFKKAPQGSYSGATATQRILCSQMSTWSID